MNTNDPEGYQAALERVASYHQPEPGFLRISGEDWAAFLQRQTTNDVRLVDKDQAVPTVLTTPTARIIDVLYLLPPTGNTVDLLTLPGRGAATAAYLKGHIFFMDKVKVQDASTEFVQIDILGPGREKLLEDLGIASPPEVNRVASFLLDGVEGRLLQLPSYLGLGYRLLVSSDQQDAVTGALKRAGVAKISPNAYEVLRLEAGVPAAGHELTGDYTPLENRLEPVVSDSKGCYTGQEVIARQLTYDKVTARLSGLQLTAPLIKGARIWADGKRVGELTSVSKSPRFGWIGLAILKRPYFEPGNHLLVGEEASSASPAQTVSLPFA